MAHCNVCKVFIGNTAFVGVGLSGKLYIAYGSTGCDITCINKWLCLHV